AYPGQIEHLETVLCDVLEAARVRANGFIKQFWDDGNYTTVFGGVFGEYSNLLKFASYLCGHLDGAEMSIEENAPRASNALKQHAYFVPFMTRLRQCLTTMWEQREAWTGLDVYNPLKLLTKELVLNGGVAMSDTERGLHVRVILPGVLPN